MGYISNLLGTVSAKFGIGKSATQVVLSNSSGELDIQNAAGSPADLTSKSIGLINSHKAKLQAPTLSVDYALTLPSALPTSTMALLVDTSGNMSYGSSGGGGGGSIEVKSTSGTPDVNPATLLQFGPSFSVTNPTTGVAQVDAVAGSVGVTRTTKTLISRVALSSNTAGPITFASSPGTYSRLEIRMRVAIPDSVWSGDVFIAFNSDTNVSNYVTYAEEQNGGSIGGYAVNARNVGWSSGASAGRPIMSDTLVYINHYADSFYKTATYVSNIPRFDSWFTMNGAVTWVSTTAINHIDITSSGSSGEFLAGSIFELYGELEEVIGNGSGTGTVTSVGLTTPTDFAVSGSPVTSSGTLALSYTSQSANLVFASPNGSSGTPSFRNLVAADLPTVSLSSGVTGTLPLSFGGTNANLSSSGPGFLRQNLAGASVTVSLLADSDIPTTLNSHVLLGGSIDGTPIGATTPSSGVFSSLAVNIGGFAGSLSHSNTANRTYSYPDTSGTVALIGATQTLTNKTLTTPTIGDFTNANHTHTNSANGGLLDGSAIGTGYISAGRLPAFSGDVSTSAGSAVTALANVGASGTYTKVTTDAKGRVTSGAALSTTDLPTVDLSGSMVSGTLAAARMPALTGDVTTSAGAVATTLAAVGTAGTYTKVTTDSKGRVTSGTTLSSTDIPSLSYISSTATQSPNKVLAGPSSGSTAAAPTFRSLVAADIPSLAYVTSVGISLPTIFSITGSPVTSSGTLTATLANQSANTFLAAPNGSSGTPTFRALVSADISSILAAPPAIGGTTPASGSFTTLTSTALSSNPSANVAGLTIGAQTSSYNASGGVYPGLNLVRAVTLSGASTTAIDTAIAPILSSSSANITGYFTPLGILSYTAASYTGTIASMDGIHIQSGAKLGGTWTVQTGLYIENITSGATNYAIYTNAGAIRLGGNIGFYGNTPVAQQSNPGGSSAFLVGAGTSITIGSTFDGYTVAQVVKALRNYGLLL